MIEKKTTKCSTIIEKKKVNISRCPMIWTFKHKGTSISIVALNISRQQKTAFSIVYYHHNFCLVLTSLYSLFGLERNTWNARYVSNHVWCTLLNIFYFEPSVSEVLNSILNYFVRFIKWFNIEPLFSHLKELL